MKNEAARLVDQFERAHDGDAWHGSPITSILEGVTYEQAARRPPGGAHSIWVVQHDAYHSGQIAILKKVVGE